MSGLIAIIIVILLAVILVQLGRVSDLAAKIRGEEKVEQQGNDRTAFWLVIFMIVFLIGCVVSAYYYKDVMLGYGPHQSASAHGGDLDSLFNVTLFFTGIVFILTQILLFWYSYKYRYKKGRVSKFFVHSTSLEMVWTIIPAIVMTFLVVKGLMVWNSVMPDVGPEDEVLEIEATGYQFAWDIRYPGKDGQLGTKDFTKIQPGYNDLGMDWNDEKTHDDIVLSGADIIYLPVDTMVRVRITSKDVLHNFYLPHFRVKMDAIPGLPTYFIFTPTVTTEEYRERLRDYPEWQVPADPTEPDGPQRWEAFDYELACAELCGTGHYSMRRIVRIVSLEEYNEWAAGRTSFYYDNVRNTDDDPFKGKLLNSEIKNRKRDLNKAFNNALSATDEAAKTIRLEHVFFATGSATLEDRSKYELNNVADLIKKNNVTVELAGHTDSVGDDAGNMSLSEARAQSVLDYLLNKGVSGLSAKGYGETQPVGDNETEEGRAENRRTELRIK